MERTDSDIFSTLSGESVLQRLYKKTSLYPTKKKPPSALSKTSLCSCGDRPVSLYCRTDDTLLCKPCKYRSHIRCHVERLEHVAKSILDSKEWETTLKKLTTLKHVFQKMKDNRRLKKLQHRQEKKSILQLSKRWNMLQSTRRALKREVVSGMDKHQGNLDSIEKIMARQSGWVAKQIDEYLNEFSEYLDTGNEIGAFIGLHKARKDLETFHNVLSEVTEDQNTDDVFEELRTVLSGIYQCENPGNVMLAHNLKPNKSVSLPALHENSKNINSSGELHSSARQTPHRLSRLSSASRRFRPAFRPQAIRMATFVSSLRSGRSSRGLTKTSMSIKRLIQDHRPKKFRVNSTTSDIQENHVTAMCSLPGGELLAIDGKNNKVKLFSKSDVFITELDFGSSVWDLTTISKFEVLVTCPSEGKLQRVKVTTGAHGCELAKTSYILTQKECRAICFIGNKVYVSYSGIKPCIKILSKDGIMFRSIEPCTGKITLFKNPLYMLVTKLGKLIYVSDFSLQRVVKIDQKGKLHGVIDLSPGWPLGLGTTKDEMLIVASSGTNDIKIITRGSLNTSVESDLLESDPCAITVKETKEGKQLYIACTGSSFVNVFAMV
ncbi:uncharacterized protein LOC128547758 [Mercenaria mercenaria]|uniref:uncharacterized protein LOC128547758 n=1 Tax=Mercenaria mercenaria TaxID=6596 RepID=UPI00234E5343|nr:uncharacterized protein LOC128547758 [Mercenaria mercenaria]